MEAESGYVETMMAKMIAATGMPTCFICGERIVGAHLDYMDSSRIPRKICIGCCYKALDYYITAREEGLKKE